MGIARGTNIVRDGLVFGYDSGYNVADPGISTRFYKGKPTTNIASGSAFIHDTASGSAGSCVDAPEKGPGWKKVTITAIGSNFRVVQFGSYPTMAANVIHASSFEADWGNLRGKGYFITQDGNGGGTRNYFKNGSYANGSTGNVSIDSTLLDGHFGMNIVRTIQHVHVPFIDNNNTNTSGRNDYFYYKEYQQEIGTIPTPFVDGTRSGTNSLIDLKRTSSIDVSNTSFNSSTGQMTFDGSDDYIDIGSDDVLDLGSFTQEAIFQPLAINRRNPIIADNNPVGSDLAHAMWLEHYNDNKLMLIFGDGTTHASTSSSTLTITDTTKYHHVVCIRDNTLKTVEFIVNGVSDGVKDWVNKATVGNPVVYDGSTSALSYNHYVGAAYFGSTKAYANIPVVKIYNRMLTADEIKQNYKAYKNRFNL